MEEYRKIKGFERYSVSNYGNVRSDITGIILSKRKANNGYLRVNLRTGKVAYEKPTVVHVHRLVAEAFLPNPCKKKEVNHIDGNKHNNCVENLEWVTRAENMYHARVSGLLRPNYGANHFKSKPVIAYDFKTHQKLAQFESAHIASRFCGSENPNHILDVCNGKRAYAFGYFWTYSEEEAVTTTESEKRVG